MSQDLEDRFAVTPWTDHDWDVGGEGLVALNLRAEEELQRNIISVLAARRLGNRSVDYTRKTYFKDFSGHRDHDLDFKRSWREQSSAYDQFYHIILQRNEAPLGEFAFDLTMVRSRITVDLLMYSARRGLLIESCTLARSLIEQYAYATAVCNSDTDSDVFGYQPQTKIGALKRVYPSAARAYGILSRLSHYHPREHYNFIGDSAGANVVQRSWKFKIIAAAWLILIFDLKFHVFKAYYGDRHIFDEAEIELICGQNRQLFEQVFSNVVHPGVERVRDLMKTSQGEHAFSV